MSEKSLTAEGDVADSFTKVGKRSQANRFFLVGKPVFLPLLAAIFPVIFYYGNNANILTFPSLIRTILLYGGISVVLYLVILLATKNKPFQAANAAFIFMIFFDIYGLIYTYLLKIDIFRVEDYTLLPLSLLVTLYTVQFTSRLKPVSFWKVAVFITGCMVAFNMLKIIPSEVEKYRMKQQLPAVPSVSASAARNNYPDIYYFMFDEFASFDTMKTYWNFQGVNDFVNFLSSRGFYVAENSKGNSIDTLHLMAQRLNYETLDLETGSLNTFYNAISRNRVMAYLKNQGYTTVVFSEINFGYPAMPPIAADYSFTYGSSDVTKAGIDTGVLFDDFGMLVAQNTMLRVLDLPNRKSIDPIFTNHQDMLYFTQEKITNLSDIPSPKFVYVHLLLPHYPFMFREDGSLNQPEGFYKWDNYLGNYKFSLNYAKKIVNDLLDKADPTRPPVIVLQSDHGPRNIVVESRGGVPLENFPEELKTHILNALYLPGCNAPDLTQQMDPINTFPIVFNCYFNAGIPLQ